ncbi:MAG: hypothetical protein K8S16_03160 [Bacteroidales bacterium]|nr:hypothetical protein [Bacteroidales bacterium]
MSIQYIEPLSRGWNRMKKALFQPFDISKWFIVGFTAFLAALLDGAGGGGSNSNNYGRKHSDLDELFNFPAYAWEWLNSHPFWFTLIVTGVIFLFVLSIVLTWVSSRGKFMFLYNVVNDKAEVKIPWYEYKREGNSLFLWRFIYGLICFIIVIVSFVFIFVMIRNIYYDYMGFSAKIFSILGMVLYFLVLFIVMGYISLYLNSFIIPIMYKYKITTSHAWFKFLPLLSRNLGNFILYGIFVFVLIILVVIAVLIFGFASCCIGFLLLIIPYIGSVVFLPISYTYRAFSVEYLEQFGDDFKIFPEKGQVEVVP